MGKKIGIIVVIILLVAGVAVLAVKLFDKSKSKETLTGAESDLNVLTKEYPTEILVYGAALEFDEKIATKNITEITSESLKKDSKYQYHLIVVNDLSAQYPLTDDQWNLIKGILDSGNDTSFFYLGNKQFDKICELGIVDAEASEIPNGNLSIGAFYRGGTKTTVTGTYTTAFPMTQKSICEAIMHEQAYSISGNK